VSPERMSGLAYWSSGGSVAGRCGPLALGSAVELLGFLNREAEACLAQGDGVAARFCAELALEFGCAVAKAVTWRRCGRGLGGPRSWCSR
jgi:hypothetical protein